MRTVLLLVAATALLGACNRLSSDSAVVTESSGTRLRPGLWRVEDSRCSVAERARTETWPECAEWLLVRDASFATLEGEAKAPRWAVKPYVLAGGEVQALQIRDGDGDYALYGVRALSTDAEGRAIRIQRWTIACGPEEATGARNADGTREKKVTPFEGVTMTGDRACRPTGADGLMAAARADEQTAKVSLTLHWVRDEMPPTDAPPAAPEPPREPPAGTEES